MAKHVKPGVEVGSGLQLTGGAREDYLVGGSGNDTIDGRGGTDFLVGGKGNDVLTGGTGTEDHYAFNIGDGVDLVTDFQVAAAGAADSTFDHLSFSFGTYLNGLNGAPVDGYVWDGWYMTTSEGHVLTITQDGADTLLSWDTGDAVRLAGMDVNSFHTGMLYLYSSDTHFA